MSNIISSPNMSLPVPIVGADPGPQYAIDINSCLAILDGHTHAAGSGVLITPAALNINAALTFSGNLATNVGAINFLAQSSDPIAGSIYEKGVDLYYIDGNSNVIRITQSGSVAGASGTITGLPNGTASASYAGSVFTFQSATNTPANVDGGSFIFRNNIANSNALTLSPPNAMGSNYSLTLPSVPAQTNVMTLDSSGNMGSVTYDFVGQSMTSVGANAIANTRTRSVSSGVAPLGGVGISAPIGNFVYNSIGISGPIVGVNVTASGNRPMSVSLVSSATNSPSIVGTSNGVSSTTFSRFYLLRDGSIIASYDIQMISSPGSSTVESWVPSSSIAFIDPTCPSGVHNYALHVAGGTPSDFTYVFNCSICVYEI